MPFRSSGPRSSSSKKSPTRRRVSLGDHDLAGPGLRLQTRGEVRRLAHDRLFLRGSRADEVAHHDQSCRDADPAGERRAVARQRRHGFADCQSSAHGSLGLVLMRPRPAEIGEHPVPHEFGDVTVEARDFACYRVLEGAKQLPHLLRVEPAGERRRSDEIDEHHCELPAFPAGRSRPGRIRPRAKVLFLRLRLQLRNGA